MTGASHISSHLFFASRMAAETYVLPFLSPILKHVMRSACIHTMPCLLLGQQKPTAGLTSAVNNPENRNARAAATASPAIASRRRGMLRNISLAVSRTNCGIFTTHNGRIATSVSARQSPTGHDFRQDHYFPPVRSAITASATFFGTFA